MKHHRPSETKTGILLPKGSQAYERSAIISRVESMLQDERLRMQRSLGGIQRKREQWIPCEACKKLGLNRRMKRYWMRTHLAKHALFATLGIEKSWVEETVTHRKRWRAKGQAALRSLPVQLARKEKKEARAVRDFLQTTLHMKRAQQQRLGWVSLRLLGPFMCLPGYHAAFDHQGRMPLPMERQYKQLVKIARNMTIDQDVTVSLRGLLTEDERQQLKEQFDIREIIERNIRYTCPSSMQFVMLDKRTQRVKRSSLTRDSRAMASR